MRQSLAIRNLAHNKGRTLVAIGGVCFAVTLLFMQLGFFASVSQSATLVYDALEFDLLLTSPRYVALAAAETFPRARLSQAQAHPDVEAVMPVYVGRQFWRNPNTGFCRAVLMLGINPSDPVSCIPELERRRRALAVPDTVLVDRLSRSELGPIGVGVVTDVGPRNLDVIGQFTIGPGFETGLVVVSDQTFSAVLGGRTLSDVNIGLVKLRSGADPEKVAQDLSARLPADVVVMTRSEVNTKERHHWVATTSTGIIFGCGVAVAVLFGVVITYQVLSLEVTHRLAEYATLKALGFSDVSLSSIVLQQAVVFAVVSYVPGYVFALLIYAIGGTVTGLPIGMTATRAVVVFFVNLLLCCLSGLLAMRILRRADPVDLF